MHILLYALFSLEPDGSNMTAQAALVYRLAALTNKPTQNAAQKGYPVYFYPHLRSHCPHHSRLLFPFPSLQSSYFLHVKRPSSLLSESLSSSSQIRSCGTNARSLRVVVRNSSLDGVFGEKGAVHCFCFLINIPYSHNQMIYELNPGKKGQ